MEDSPKIVAETLKRFFRQRGTLQEAAAKLGVGPTTLSNQLNGKAYFTRKNAVRYAAVFGLNADYLVTGRGELCPDFSEPKALFSIAPSGSDKGTSSVEERIYIGLHEQIRKLNELANTYNNLVEHILDVSGYVGSGSKFFEYCEAVQKSLNGLRVEQVVLPE